MTQPNEDDRGNYIEIAPTWPDQLGIDAVVVNHFALFNSPDQGFYLVGGHVVPPLLSVPGDFEKFVARTGGVLESSRAERVAHLPQDSRRDARPDQRSPRAVSRSPMRAITRSWMSAIAIPLLTTSVTISAVPTTQARVTVDMRSDSLLRRVPVHVPMEVGMGSSAPAVRYTAKQLGQLEQRTRDWALLTRNAIDLLVQVTDRSTVFPSAVYIGDENDLVVYWRGGDWTLEVEITATGHFFVTSMTDDSFDQFEGGRADVPRRKQLRVQLADLSKHVQDANPRWREIFA